jgi:hypothetical protein
MSINDCFTKAIKCNSEFIKHERELFLKGSSFLSVEIGIVFNLLDSTSVCSIGC